jgi:hypothetical protein
MPADPLLVEVAFDRDAEAAELGQVIDGSPRGGELEVDEGNSSAIAEHDVRGLNVVVADDRPARRVGKNIVPSEPARVESA